MSHITIGRLLRLARADKGITQKQLVIDVYQLEDKDLQEIRNKMIFYSAIENDRSPLPNAIIGRLCEILEMPVQAIIEAKVAKYRAKLEKLANKSN